MAKLIKIPRRAGAKPGDDVYINPAHIVYFDGEWIIMVTGSRVSQTLTSIELDECIRLANSPVSALIPKAVVPLS